jgi:plasmid stabilization system protein ParE
MRVRYRLRAQRDIDSIYEYIKERNPRAATEVVARIRLAADRLGRFVRARVVIWLGRDCAGESQGVDDIG